MTTCTRRALTYWTTCDCPPCVKDRHRAHKRHSTGAPYRIPNDLAWEHLAAKIDAGWTARAIGSATGLGEHYFTRHLAQYRKGRRVYLGPAVAAAIMRMGRPTEGQVGAEPSRRRLRALAVIGHGLASVEAETGIRFSTLAAIRNDAAQRCGARAAGLIEDAYERLGMSIGDDAQAQRIARKKGWASPLAWNNIDDLSERPAGQHTATDRGQALRDMADMGMGITEAARRLHLTRDAIERWAQRNDMSDVYHELAGREARRGNQHSEAVA